MLTLALLAPGFSLHFLLQIVLVIAACWIVFWLLQKVTIPEPLNIVVYAVLAAIAVWLLFQFLG